MPTRRLRLAMAALIGLAGLSASAAGAQYYGRAPRGYYQPRSYDRAYDARGDYERGYYDRAGYGRPDRGYGRPDRGYVPPPRGYRGRGPRYDDRPRYRCDRGTGGTIIGAIAGGLLGNAVVGRGDRAIGTIAGAGAGALAGRAVDRDC